MQWAAKSLYPQPTAQTQQQTTYLELMEALIKAGADANARLTKHLWYMSFNFDLLGVNTAGATPFWRAAYGHRRAGDEAADAHGADPSDPDDEARRSACAAPMRPRSRTARERPIRPDCRRSRSVGPACSPIHAASGVGYGEGYAANSHMHAPDAWLPSVKYLVEEFRRT